MDTSKTYHDSCITSKIIKENAVIFTNYFLLGYNNAIMQSGFPSILKLAAIIPAFKKSERNLRIH